MENSTQREQELESVDRFKLTRRGREAMDPDENSSQQIDFTKDSSQNPFEEGNSLATNVVDTDQMKDMAVCLTYVCFISSALIVIILVSAMTFNIPNDLPHLKGVLERIMDSYQKFPILDVIVQDANTSCPQGYQPQQIGQWKGITEMGLVSSKYPPKPLYSFKNMSICVNREPTPIFSEYKSYYCPPGTKDCYETLCYPEKTQCPITDSPGVHLDSTLWELKNKSAKFITEQQSSDAIIDFNVSYIDDPCLALGFNQGKSELSPKYIQKFGCGTYGTDQRVRRFDYESEKEYYNENKVEVPEVIARQSTGNIMFLGAVKNIVLYTYECFLIQPQIEYLHNRIATIHDDRYSLGVIIFLIELVWIFLISYYVARLVKKNVIASKGFKIMVVLLSITEMLIIFYGIVYVYYWNIEKAENVKTLSYEKCFLTNQATLAVQRLLEFTKRTKQFWVLYFLIVCSCLMKLFLIFGNKQIKSRLIYRELPADDDERQTLRTYNPTNETKIKDSSI